MKKWFTANIVHYPVLKYGKQEEYCCTEDLYYIFAENYEVALAKAVYEAGFEAGDGRYHDMTLGGKPATNKVAGIRRLTECENSHGVPQSGTEISNHEYIVDKENFEKLLEGKEEFWITTVEQNNRYLMDKADAGLYGDDEFMEETYELDEELEKNVIWGAAHLLYRLEPAAGLPDIYHIYERVVAISFKDEDEAHEKANNYGRKYEAEFASRVKAGTESANLTCVGRRIFWWMPNGQEPEDTATSTYWDYCMDSEADIIKFANGEQVRVCCVPL